MTLTLTLFGLPVLERDGEPIHIPRRKALALLAYLAVEARPQSRESLVALLWPDYAPADGRADLSRTLNVLRRHVGNQLFQTDRQSVALDPDAELQVDVVRFRRLWADGRPGSGRNDEYLASLVEAAALYQADFLSGFTLPDSPEFDTWQLWQTENLRGACSRLLAELAQRQLERSDAANAIETAQRLVSLDPLHEPGHQLLMELYDRAGRAPEALRHYTYLVDLLKKELDAAPQDETVAQYERIRSGGASLSGRLDHSQTVIQAGELSYRDAQSPASPSAIPRGHLPHQPTAFVGRDSELAEIGRRLADPACRLLTLVGPGGIGKTRLAVEAASRQRRDFGDGAFFVPLAQIASAEFIVPTTAATLGVILNGDATSQNQLLRYLHQQELLLVLDNFEHLLPVPAPLQQLAEPNAAVTFVSSILESAPNVTLLVTTRERLNLEGEWVYDVGGLELPSEEASSALDYRAEAYSALTLFLQMARRVEARFAPTAADHAAIVRICRMVDGMPLALELAAAWVRVLSCREIAEEIEESLGFLTTTQRNASPRHRSMQAVFDHSWKLLSAEEQRVFAGCSVFRGGFTRAAAVDVAGATLPILAALVDKSLLRRNRQQRYEIHELARQFAADRLAEAQQTVQTRQHHLRFFMQFAEEAEPQLKNGQHVVEWLDRVEHEHDNLRAALEWALNGGEFTLGLRIVGALWDFWMDRGYAHEGRVQATRYLSRPEASADTYLRAKALHTAGVLAYYLGSFAAARASLHESIALSRQLETQGKPILTLALVALGHTLTSLEALDAVEMTARESLHLGHESQDAFAHGHALLQLATVAQMRGDNTSAQQHILASMESFEIGGDRGMYGTAVSRYGIMLYEQGDYAAAYAQAAKSLTVFEEVDDTVRRGMALRHLGVIAMAKGDNAQAQEFLYKALKLMRKVGQLRWLIDVLDIMGRLAQRQHDYAQSSALLQESLDLAVEMNHRPWIARAQEALACLAAEQGRMDDAARLFGAAEALSVPMETRLDPVWIREHGHWVGIVRTELGETAFAAAWAAGSGYQTGSLTPGEDRVWWRESA